MWFIKFSCTDTNSTINLGVPVLTATTMFSTFKSEKKPLLSIRLALPNIRVYDNFATPNANLTATSPDFDSLQRSASQVSQQSEAAIQAQKLFGRSKEKSRKGCLTCKFRKKKCNEVKPVCRDCLRFGKECVWVDYETMTSEQIKALRMRVQQQESLKKMRKRRRVNDKDELADSAKAEDYSDLPDSKLLKIDESDGVKPLIGPSREYIEALKTAYPISSPPFSQLQSGELLKTLQYTPTGLAYINRDNGHISLHDCANTAYDTKDSLNNDAHQHSGIVNRGEELSAFTVPLSLPRLRGRPELPVIFGSSPKAVSPPPLDLEYYRDAPEINPGSPAALLKFFKELSLHNIGRNSSKASLLEISDKEPAAADDMDVAAMNQKLLQQSSQTDDSPDFKLSPKFNIPDFLDHVLTLSHDSPSQFNHLASSFNAAFASSPQPPLSLLPGLNPTGNYLYNYYVDTLSRKVSIAPPSQNESNSYQKVFLPLAQKDKGVLYGILAWSGFHLGGSWLSEGSKYAEMAVKHLTQDVDFNTSSLIKDNRRAILNKLATILILCGAEICRGDVKYWSIYLDWGWKLLKDNGGILNFDTNKEEHWLISNFAYHDLMASSTSQRKTYFPIVTYQRIFADPAGLSKGSLNPLLGVHKNLFKVIGDINSLAYESKRSLENYYNRGSPLKSSISPTQSNNSQSPDDIPVYLADFDDMDSDMSEHGRTSRLILSIIEKVKELERIIDISKPDPEDLVDLSDSDLELQLTTFEAFQLSCKLYLRQSIMKCNPSSLESQVLVNDLVKCIDILIETPMQATLVFPIFIAGIHMVTEDDKATMNLRIQKMMEMYGPWNVVRVKYLIERVWERNPEGDRVVDWHAILMELGWDINFA